MLTVVPDASSRLNVSPAGTVNEFILTVVHLTASDTSSSEDIVPVQVAEAGDARVVREARRTARTVVRKADIAGLVAARVP